MERPKIDIFYNETNNLLCNAFEVDTGDINTIVRTARIVVTRQGYSFKVGDKLRIDAGYISTGIYPIFNGYITNIERNDDFWTLSCEDEAWVAKSIILKEETTYNAKLKDLVKKYYTGKAVVNYGKGKSGELGDFKTEGTPTFFDLLGVFRERYGIVSYFDSLNTLHIDLLRTINDKTVDIVWGNAPDANVFDEQTENVRNAQDDARKRVIYGVSRQKDDTYKKVWGYIEGGKVKVSKKPVNGYIDKLEINGISESELENYVKLRLEKGAYNGKVGELPITFDRFVKPFDQLHFVDKREGEAKVYEDEKYLCDQVRYSFDFNNGLMQVVNFNYKL
jgi:hypothetical protein